MTAAQRVDDRQRWPSMREWHKAERKMPKWEGKERKDMFRSHFM